MQSAFITGKGVLGLARDLELYETRALGHNDIHGLVWLPQGSLIVWHDGGLWRVRGSELDPVLTAADLLQKVRGLPDARARSCTAIEQINSLTMASLHGKPLVLAVFSFRSEEQLFAYSLAALYLEVTDRDCYLKGYLFPPPAARGLASLPVDQGRDRVTVPFTEESPIRWYRSVETHAATTFVEIGRLDADHRGIVKLAALTRNRVIAYDIDGKVTVRDLSGGTAPVVIHEGFGVRAMRLCDATSVKSATCMVFRDQLPMGR